MTREQAINYLISRGLSHEQVGDVVRALTYEPTTKNNLGVQMTNGEKMISAFPNGEVSKCEKGVVFSTGGWCHAYADEWWNAEYKEPTTKNDSSELEKNSKKLEKGTTKNDLGVDCVSRGQVLGLKIHAPIAPVLYSDNSVHYEDIILVRDVEKLPSITPQLSVPEVTALAEWTEKLTKASEDAYNKGYEAGIKALEQEPQTFKWCTDCKEYDQEKHCCHRWSKVIRDTVQEMKQEQEPILDKIRVEIDQYLEIEGFGSEYRNDVKGIINKYKAEMEG